MPYLRKAEQRGKTELDWLKSYHSFSFADYFDPNHISFSVLRVINDDVILPNSGFGFHPHSNMEIITYLIAGSVMHRDNLGNQEVISAPQIQVMSAGSGIIHSEVNPSPTETLKLLQIWIKPHKINIEPFYEQKVIEQEGKLTPLVLPRQNNPANAKALTINQNASLFRLVLKSGESLEIGINNKIYLHIIHGKASIIPNQIELKAGDGLGLSQLPQLSSVSIEARADLEALLFELP